MNAILIDVQVKVGTDDKKFCYVRSFRYVFQKFIKHVSNNYIMIMKIIFESLFMIYVVHVYVQHKTISDVKSKRMYL